MITVTLITNEGSGLPRDIDVRNGTTIEAMLSVSFQGDPEEFTVTVRPSGEASYEADLDEVLKDGDRISLASKKVEGGC